MKPLIIGAIALSFLTGSAAFAQRFESRDARPDYSDRRGPDATPARGRWSEGEKIPYEYMKGGQYITYNWGENGLQRPPQGYAWMKIGDQFYLADQQSGQIRDVKDARRERPALREGGQVPYDLMVGGKNIYYQWRESGLPKPPNGYAWMMFGQQYFLANQKSGLIKEVRDIDDQHRGRGMRSNYDERRRN